MTTGTKYYIVYFVIEQMFYSIGNAMDLPARLYICPECTYSTRYRWVLAQHLRNVHDFYKGDSIKVAAEYEYWANPHYIRTRNIEERR